MIICSTNERLMRVIRQLEGNDSIPDAELLEMGHEFGFRLGQYLKEFGFTVEGTIAQRGEVFDWRVGFTTRDRETIVSGLQVLQPLYVTVEPQDLENLILDKIPIIALRDSWDAVQPFLTRIQPGEIGPRIDDLIMKICFAPLTDEQRLESEIGFESWCLANGIKPPGQAWNRYEQQKQMDYAAEQKRKNDAVDAWLNG